MYFTLEHHLGPLDRGPDGGQKFVWEGIWGEIN